MTTVTLNSPAKLLAFSKGKPAGPNAQSMPTPHLLAHATGGVCAGKPRKYSGPVIDAEPAAASMPPAGQVARRADERRSLRRRQERRDRAARGGAFQRALNAVAGAIGATQRPDDKGPVLIIDVVKTSNGSAYLILVRRRVSQNAGTHPDAASFDAFAISRKSTGSQVWTLTGAGGPNGAAINLHGGGGWYNGQTEMGRFRSHGTIDGRAACFNTLAAATICRQNEHNPCHYAGDGHAASLVGTIAGLDADALRSSAAAAILKANQPGPGN